MAQAAEKVLEFPAGGIADFYVEDDEIAAMEQEEAKKAFGDNGIANFSDVASRMASYGRGGDDTIAHVATGEIVIPLPLIENNPEMKASIFKHLEELGIEDPEQYVVGSSANSINPETGLREFGWLKKTFKKVTRAVKKVGKSVVKLVKKAAPIVLPFILGPLVGPLYAGALGAGIGTLIQGGSLKDAFQAALMGGAIGGATAAIGGGVSAVAKGGTFAQGAMSGIKNAASLSNFSNLGGKFSAAYGSGNLGGAKGALNAEANSAATTSLEPADVVSLDTDIGANLASTPMDATTRNDLYGVSAKPAALTPDMPPLYGPDPMAMGATPAGVGDTSAMFTSGVPDSTLSNIQTGSTNLGGGDGLLDTAKGYYDTATDYLVRGGQSKQAIAEAAAGAEQKAIQNTLVKYGQPPGPITNATPPAIAAKAIAAGEAAAAAAQPGMLATFGPSLALAGGAAYLGGGFTAPEVEEEDFGPTGEDLRRMYPEKYGFSNQEAPRRSNQPTYVGSSFSPDPRFMYPEVRRGNPFYNPDSVYQRRAEGGEIFPRRVGGIMPDEGIPGRDSVRAMLMPGEFVMTTDAVKGLGNGNNQQGIQNMYQMMRGLEAKGKAIA